MKAIRSRSYAGVSLMAGNYPTTLNHPIAEDLQMLKDLGLDPCWDNHGFTDQESVPAELPAVTSINVSYFISQEPSLKGL